MSDFDYEFDTEFVDETQQSIKKHSRQAEYRREQRAAVQDVGAIPPIADRARRDAATKSLKVFCETYFKELFYLDWSDIHLEVIDALERVVNKGELFCMALPRGSGKTTLSQCAILWSLITGRRRFALFIASNAPRAEQLLKEIRIWLETNELLAADFPEVCIPFQSLAGVTQRAWAQTCMGERTFIEIKRDAITFPTIDGSVCSGARLVALGLTSSGLRGLASVDAQGHKIRPDLILCDDPQDRESAQSTEQTNNRERIVKSDLLGMAGPGKKIAMLITITVIAEDDLAQRLLDREKNPEFRGKRYKLMKSLPENVALWNEYRAIRENSIKNDGSGEQATEFYKLHREEMDLGAQASWPARFNEDEISAIQNAMNLKFRDSEAFTNEYQNEPTCKQEAGTFFDPSATGACLSGNPRGWIPEACQFVTGHIDVHKNLLYYVLTAWDLDFNGVIVDYGVYPKQTRSFFKLSDAYPTLLMSSPSSSLEAALYNGASNLFFDMFSREYLREDGVEIPLKRLLIDANWGQSTDIIYKCVADSDYRNYITPAHGQYLGASSKPWGERKFNKGDFVGNHWLSPNKAERHKIRHVVFDSNFWKSAFFARITAHPGDVGRLTIDGAADEHTLFAQHLSAEYAVPTEARGRRVDEWKLREAHYTDNHWFDCAVGSCVAASMCGAKLPVVGEPMQVQRRKRIGEYNGIKKIGR